MFPTTESVLAVIRASRPELRSAHDRVAFALHATFVACGYSLSAAGSRARAPRSAREDEEEASVDGWNQPANAYAFRYFTQDKEFAQAVEVSCTVINDSLMVDAAPQGYDLVHVEMKVMDFAKDSDGGNYAQQYKDLDGLVKLVSSKILSKCMKTPPAIKSTGNEGNMFQDHLPLQNLPSAHPPSRPAMGLHSPVGLNDLMPSSGAGCFESGRDATFESGEAGNLVGPNNAIWGPPQTGIPRPPGPRRDPFGPPGVPGFGPGQFGRGGGGSDLQHFPGGSNFM